MNARPSRNRPPPERSRAPLPAPWKAALVAALAACALLRAVPDARALGAHEVVLLVNANSADSREIANHYAKLRGIPPQNLLLLDVPANFGGAPCTITTQQFGSLIWTPAMKLVAERGLSDHMLAWAYSAGFPSTIDYPKPVSLHGMTFVRGRLPPPESVDKAGYSSPLFRGPGVPNGPQGPSTTLEQFAMSLGTNFPMPSMTLGHIEPRGLPVADVLDSLRYAYRSDCTRPAGAVNFVLSQDVRSTCRAWQVPGVVAELARLGVRAVVTTNEPERFEKLMGLQVGSALIDRFTNTQLQPGSMAEHLTSLGAIFDNPDQGKIPQWIKAGASGTAGTVTEPYALWPKFPHARFFVHYASGCTMLESFAQAVASPLQLFLLGDPLARPYGRVRPVSLICLAGDDSAISGTAEFMVTEANGSAARDLTTIYLLDGRVALEAGNGTRALLDAAKLDDGWHELRVVGYSGGAVKQQCSAVKFFGVRNHGRGVKAVLSGGSPVKSSVPAELKLEATGGAERFEVLAQQRVIASGTNAVLAVDFSSAGPGPVWLQAVAHYPGGGIARSRPQLVDIKKAAP